jgi:hypothetical protein
MKVTSPIGDLPLELDRLTGGRGGLVVEASMGAWPARIELDARDVPQILRVVRLPLTACVVLLACLVVGRRVRGSADPPRPTATGRARR